MKVSVVIPVYNVEPYMADCLRSVMRQTYAGPMECIVVDDCGKDRSVEVAAQLIAEYKGPIVFRILRHEQNRGLSAARNTGMDAANGEYVFFIDSDDWISDDCIERLAKPLQEGKVDIVVGDYEMIGKQLYKKTEMPIAEGRHEENGVTNTFCDVIVYPMVWNNLYRRNFLMDNNLRFEEGKVHEDNIFAFDISCIHKVFYIVKAVTYFYRIRENSIMTDDNKRRKIEDCVRVLDSVKKRVERFATADGIYDLYMHYVKKVIRWISAIDMDKELVGFADEKMRGCLDAIPSVRCLGSKHDRLAYFGCRNEQTFSRYQYITTVYANTTRGRMLRNLLNLLPHA